ncbi:MAG: flagellar hook-associated protein FlgK [Tepidisphaeraceae bacterium]|jgi:flagellar hook-associated protein 1 FlgK
MSLMGVLNIGGSALQAQQAALQVTSNNLANAADPNYTEETAEYEPGGDVSTGSGLLVGSGVNIVAVQRQVDQALNERLRSSNSDESSATTLQNWSGQVQSVFNALSGNGLSDQLNTFFNDWSTLASNPTQSGQQGVVVQDGANVAQTLNGLSSNLSDLSTNMESSISQSVQQVNQLSGQIASLNQQIVGASNGGSVQPNSLLDQRDADLSSLSQLVNIQTVQQPSGSVNVYLGSEALVDGTSTQNLTATTAQTNGQINTTVNFQQDGSVASVTSGSLGGLLQSEQLINNTTTTVNSLASSLISSLNSIYSNGQGPQGYTTVTSTNTVADPTQPLSSAAAGLTYPPTSGTFTIHLTNTTTGLTTSSLIPITETGGSSDTTLNSLAASLNGVSGVQANVNNGQLSISSTNPNVQISFSNDTSGVLAGLGINTFFTGSDASSIAVNPQLTANSSLLAISQGGAGVDTLTAQNISNLNDAPQPTLGGSSLSDSYDNLIQTVGSAASNATNNATAATSVQQTLTAQQQSLSGVSTDQEALNMIIEQRTYQGAAQLISIVDNMMQTLLAIT